MNDIINDEEYIIYNEYISNDDINDTKYIIIKLNLEKELYKILPDKLTSFNLKIKENTFKYPIKLFKSDSIIFKVTLCSYDKECLYKLYYDLTRYMCENGFLNIHSTFDMLDYNELNIINKMGIKIMSKLSEESSVSIDLFLKKTKNKAYYMLLKKEIESIIKYMEYYEVSIEEDNTRVWYHIHYADYNIQIVKDKYSNVIHAFDETGLLRYISTYFVDGREYAFLDNDEF